ncbi:MAG: 4-hydroxythreonine-4-phosphate dehydrogenase PdxA [Bacteroidales bacterium]|nr:4-hydroxythreonine-4-phosphate dehydrogenase PdxA [Bacteroidales bacterium]
MDKHKIRVGISHGDINGVSYEIIIKTLLDNRIFEFCTPIVYGSSKVAAYHRKALNINNFSLNSISKPEDANIKRANIINCIDDDIKVEFGKSTEAAGNSSFVALERATQDLKDKKIDVLITAPINKNNIQSEKFHFPGHTEYLKEKFNADVVLMMMVSDIMRVGVVTGHIPISEVTEHITEENILKNLRLMNKSLIEDFGIRKPKIAVLGLNPHAGDNGVIGNEEKEIIVPSITKARKENILAIGPYPADGFFGSNSFKQFDAILAMYHDQGLAPFKAISFDSGVNYTAGLPIVRTSPAHGTAYEIVGKNIASPNSFRQALYLACDIYKNRKEHNNLIKNSIINNSSEK